MGEVPMSRMMRGVLNFTPSWFTVNMGIGVMSVLLHTSPHRFRGETTIGTALYVTNIATFLLFAAITVARYAVFPWGFRRMLLHPTQSLYLGTIPMGLATIVNATVVIAVPRYGAWVLYLTWALWWVDVALTVISVVGVPLLMFRCHKLTLDVMTASWMLPVVPAIVCSGTGALVAGELRLDLAQITLFVSYMLWGMGMALSAFVMALYVLRLAVHDLPNAEVIVSAFLPLGPCGQGATALLQLAKAGKRILDASTFARAFSAGDIVMVVSAVAALMLWGLGLWWLAHGVLAVAIRGAAARLRFHMGFWGFIFPLGVFVSATASLGELIPAPALKVLSVVLLAALGLLFVGVAGCTVAAVLTGASLASPCLLDTSRSGASAAPPAAGVSAGAAGLSTGERTNMV